MVLYYLMKLQRQLVHLCVMFTKSLPLMDLQRSSEQDYLMVAVKGGIMRPIGTYLSPKKRLLVVVFNKHVKLLNVLELKQLELSYAEELEVALESADQEHEEMTKQAVAAAQKALREEHREQMERADAALSELELLRLKTSELEQTIARLTPRGRTGGA